MVWVVFPNEVADCNADRRGGGVTEYRGDISLLYAARILRRSERPIFIRPTRTHYTLIQPVLWVVIRLPECASYGEDIGCRPYSSHESSISVPSSTL